MNTKGASAKKKKVVKNVYVKPIKNHDNIQIDIKKSLDDDKKINPNKIFDGYTAKKSTTTKGASAKKSTTKKSTTKKKSY